MNLHVSAAALATAASFALAAPSDSPFGSDATGISGQIRLRSELLHKSVADTSHSTTSNGLRSRLSYAASPSPLVLAKIELQDSRTLGSEQSTVAETDDVDLSQAWARLSLPLPDSSAKLQLAFGRMGISLGSGRFLSTLEWHPQARRFDGAALDLEAGGWSATGLGFVVSDSGLPNQGQWLTAAYLSSPAFAGGALQVEGGVFYEKTRNSLDVSTRDVTTLDLRLKGLAGAFSWEQEGLLQLGEVGTASVLAFQTATRVGWKLPAAQLGLGVDVMSGEGEGGDVERYTPSYYFGHAYFGWMDLFLANPTYGVIDLHADAAIPVGKSGVLMPQIHQFLPQRSETIDGTSIDAYGQEFDLEFHLKTFPKSNIVFGAGLFLPGDGAWAMGTAGVTSKATETAPAYYLYLMPVVQF